MANASLEDCQLFAQSEILQRDLFIAAKQQEDHPKKREDCVQHEAESVSASSLKINRFRNRWNSGEAQAQAKAGPPASTWGSLEDPIVLAGRMWNHSTAMLDRMNRDFKSWPRMTGQDVTDVLEY